METTLEIDAFGCTDRDNNEYIEICVSETQTPIAWVHVVTPDRRNRALETALVDTIRKLLNTQREVTVRGLK